MKTRFALAALLLAAVAVVSLRAADADKDALKDVKCPVSAKAINKDATVEFNGGKVYFCCENCPKAFKADNAKFAAKANHQLVQTGQLVQIACPITGKDVNKDAYSEIEGVKVSYCCNNCKGKVEKADKDEKLKLAFGDTSKSFKPAKK